MRIDEYSQNEIKDTLMKPATRTITRMKTSISSKVFCSITDRQTYKIFTEKMLIYEENLHKKNGAISQLGAEKITFPPKRG